MAKNLFGRANQSQISFGLAVSEIYCEKSGSLKQWVDAARSYMEFEDGDSQPESKLSLSVLKMTDSQPESELKREIDFWKEKCQHLELQNRGRGQSRFQENRNRERPEFRNKPREIHFPQSSTKQIPCEGNQASNFNSMDQGQSVRNQENPYRPRIICHYCLQPGHKWRFCYKRQEDLKMQGEFQPPPEGPKKNENTGETNFQ